MKIEFLIAGSPNDAFYSQVAMFRLALDALGDLYHRARIVLCLVSKEGPSPTPERWQPWLNRVEIQWADQEHAARLTHGQELFALTDASADISIICDADTMFLRPLPEDFLAEMVASPAICAVIAHYPTPTHNFDDFPGPASTPEMWQRMGEALGCPIPLTVPYLLARDGALGPSFYVNHAFVAAPPDLIRQLGVLQTAVRPALESVLTNQYDDQIAVALAVETGKLPHRRLPLRYNFPNDQDADELYPEEMQQVIMMHYLRRNAFERHAIFASAAAFDEFLALPLTGSNAVFQEAVRTLTQGKYPFSTAYSAERAAGSRETAC